MRAIDTAPSWASGARNFRAAWSRETGACAKGWPLKRQWS